MAISSDFSASKKKMQHVANISIAVMYIMYFLAALFGYLTFYGEARSSSSTVLLPGVFSLFVCLFVCLCAFLCICVLFKHSICVV